MKRTLVAVAALYMTLFLSGCSTMAGFGEDVQKGGQAIENAAKK